MTKRVAISLLTVIKTSRPKRREGASVMATRVLILLLRITKTSRLTNEWDDLDFYILLLRISKYPDKKKERRH
jgi:hypothetical protein